MLTFAYRHWEGRVPDPGELRPQDRELIAKIESGFQSVGDLLAAVKLRAALGEAIALATEANRYLGLPAVGRIDLVSTLDANYDVNGDFPDLPAIAQFEAAREANLAAHPDQNLEGRSFLAEAIALATEANRYLDAQGPWFEIKQDKAEAAKTIFTALKAIDSLKILFAPFLPFTSERLHTDLGYDGRLFGAQKIVTYYESTRSHDAVTYDHTGEVGRWQPSSLPPGQFLRQPSPLFKKLEGKIVAEERARLGQPMA